MIKGIGQIAVPINDLEISIHFYKDKLGLPLLFNTNNMAFFDAHGVRLLLSLPENEQNQHSSSVVYFNVEDIEKSYREFKEKGIEFIDQPHLVAKMGNRETWMTFFKDPFDNLHGLMSEFETEE
ncbi:VOC family protein [Bacillus suaedaesalsae]|uniref:VOC family protein n=1 Tax=Bacillus suaedaesalsae TaxID=2810349 RepID=A0ABS2DH53_9BACI|nr:VOC family protein [Bacillus suaedaesalsae]MBM6616873.1 VOC family protein [Bacillus suaedaesalsae]